MALLACRRLSKTYCERGVKKKALRSFSLSFPSHGLVAIQGKSGCGKSTLLCLLSNVEEPSSGAIYYKGKKLSDFSSRERIRYLREETSFVFQHYGLFEELTVYENVVLPLRMKADRQNGTKGSVSFLLSHFGLEGKERQIVSSLSGGEKQRVALVRALVKSPRVLFADEPTGALDEENGEEVMKMLAAMASTCLVVMVSHNNALVRKYADQIITLEDGKQAGKEIIAKTKEEKVPEGRHRSSSLWIGRFFREFSKEDIPRNILTLVAGFVGLIGIATCLAYMSSSAQATEAKAKESLEYLTATVSKKEYISVGDSPLVLTRLLKPSVDEVRDFLSDIREYSICDDLSYFFPEQTVYKMGGEECSDASFVPVFDITLQEYGKSFLSQGYEPEEGISYVYVNDQYASKHLDIIGRKLSISLQIPIKSANIEDEVTIKNEFLVCGIVREFSFLNTPKIYYSYPAFSSFLNDIRLPSFSERFHRDFSLGEFLSLYGDAYKGKSHRLFFHDPEEMAKVYSLAASSQPLSVDSSCYVAYSSFSSLSEAFSLCLWLLFAASLFGVISICAMSFLSLFIKRKPKIALLLSLGASKGEVASIFLLESAVITLCYFGLACCAYPFVQKGLNALLAFNFGIPDLIVFPMEINVLGISLPTIPLLCAATFLVSLVSTLLPIVFSMRKGLRKELRDE